MTIRAWSPVRKALVVLLLFLVGGVLATAGLTYYTIYVDQRKAINDANMSLLLQLDSKLQLVLRSIDTDIIQMLQTKDVWEFMERDFASDADYSDFMVNRLGARTNEFINGNDFIVSMDLYSYAKNRLSSGTKLNDGQIPQDYQWIETFESSKRFFAWLPTRKLTVDASSGIYYDVISLVRSYPITHPEGFRKGVLCVNISERALNKLVKDAVAASEGFIYILDGSGNVLSHSDKSLIGQPQGGDSDLVSVPLDQSKGTFRAKLDRTDNSVFYVTSAYTGWKIVSVVPDRQLNQPLIRIRNTLIAICSALIVLALVMAFLVNRWSFRPISRMMGRVLNTVQPDKLSGSEAAASNDYNRFELALAHILEDSSRMQKMMSENKLAVKWRLVLDMLSGVRRNGDELHSLLASVGFPLFKGPVVALIAEFDRSGADVSPQDMQLLCYALCNVAEEMVNAEGKGVAIELADGQAAILVSFEEHDAQSSLLRTYAIADMLRQYVEDHFKRTVTLGIGSMAEQLSDIRRSYVDALDAMNYKAIMGPNTLITPDDISESGSKDYFRLMAATETILDYVRLADPDKARVQAEKWLGEIVESKVPRDIFNQLVLQFVLRLMKLLDTIGISTEEMDMPEPKPYESVREAADQIARLLDGCVELILRKRSSLERKRVIDDIIGYLHANYWRDDLSLGSIAAEFGLSIYYLSRMFKEKTGQNFIEYLIELRIEQAKTLLRQGEDKEVRDIAEKSGYTNANSFVRIFKKSTGLTPTEYREQEWRKRGCQVEEEEL